MSTPVRYLWEWGNTTTGNYIGAASTDLIGFYGTTPVAQQSTAATSTDLATVITLANALKTALDALGITA